MFVLEVGAVYYQCGFGMVNNHESVFVSTWVYVGIVKQNCNTKECDEPFHYYQFTELESIRSYEAGSIAEKNTKLIPSLSQAERTMLNSSQLMEELEDSIKERDEGKQE